MELRQLRYFIAAAEEEHMSRAAKRLHVSQPALSQQIKDLETELNAGLFERLARGLRLTPAGQILLDQARRLISDLEHTKERLRYAGLGEVGRLRVAFNEVAGQQREVAEAFHHFRTLYPNVALDLVQLTTFEQIEALHKGEIDAGFQHNQNQDRDFLQCLTLREDEFVLGLWAAHPLARRRKIGLADLADQPFVWLHRSINPLLSDQLMARLIAHGVTPRVAFEAKSDVSMMNFISVGLGVGLVVSSRRWGDAGDVVFRKLHDLSLPIGFVLAWRHDNRSPLIENFVKAVRTVHRCRRSVSPRHVPRK